VFFSLQQQSLPFAGFWILASQTAQDRRCRGAKGKDGAVGMEAGEWSVGSDFPAKVTFGHPIKGQFAQSCTKKAVYLIANK
jgi:hypothetical protein